jgi:flagellar basal-body rod modification protein FlgD
MQISVHHIIAPRTGSSAAVSISTPKPESSSASSPSNASTNSSTSSASVTANDFLELLVTEMKNQDPTATTDPNQYINQLVQVNSLEQLIQINQDLSGGDSGTHSHQATAAAHTGNLSANTSTQTSIRAAAGQVATALESRRNPGIPATQLSDRSSSDLLQRHSAAVKP